MSTETKTRRALHAYLSDTAHDQWHDFAATNGVSVSAMLERFANELNPTSDATLHERLHEVIESARMVDAQRRRRS